MNDHRDPPRLETPRLILRAHRLDDFEPMAAMWADPAVVRHISGQPSSRQETWFRLLRYGGLWRFLGYGFWAVQDKATDAFLGEVGFADVKREIEPSLAGKPEAGWVLTPAAHGQGLATEAVRRIVAWADATLGHAATACIVDPEHKASIRVARKAGFADIARTSHQGVPTLVMERRRGAAPHG